MVTCVPSRQDGKLEAIIHYVIGSLRNRVVTTQSVKCDVDVVQLPDVSTSLPLHEVMVLGRMKKDRMKDRMKEVDTSSGGEKIIIDSPEKRVTSDVTSETKVSSPAYLPCCFL